MTSKKNLQSGKQIKNCWIAIAMLQIIYYLCEDYARGATRAQRANYLYEL